MFPVLFCIKVLIGALWLEREQLSRCNAESIGAFFSCTCCLPSYMRRAVRRAVVHPIEFDSAFCVRLDW